MIRYNQTTGKAKEFSRYHGEESASRFLQILWRAMANASISLSKAASLYNMCLAEFRARFLEVFDVATGKSQYLNEFFLRLFSAMDFPNLTDIEPKNGAIFLYRLHFSTSFPSQKINSGEMS